MRTSGAAAQRLRGALLGYTRKSLKLYITGARPRFQLEVLSVIAQQVLTIQLAKAKNLKRFTFEGTELGLKTTCCPFITMNPVSLKFKSELKRKDDDD